MTGDLAELQDALAAIVTGGPREAISLRARDALAEIPADEVSRYARGLRRKRWQEVARSIPLCIRVVAGLEARYDAWLSAHPPAAGDGVLPPGPAEALRALPALWRALDDDGGEAPWSGELLAFEVLAACSRVDGAPRALRARYSVHEIAAELRAGLVPVDPPARPHSYAFDRRGTRWKKLP